MDTFFDPTRKKHLKATPEEEVRQWVLQYLVAQNYPIAYIKTEVELQYGDFKKKADIVVYTKDIEIFMVIECKAASIPLNNKHLQQVMNYAIALEAAYILLTNGKNTYIASIDSEKKTLSYVKNLPLYPNL